MTRLCRFLAGLFLLFAFVCVGLFVWALGIDESADAAVFALCAVVNAMTAHSMQSTARSSARLDQRRERSA